MTNHKTTRWPVLILIFLLLAGVGYLLVEGTTLFRPSPTNILLEEIPDYSGSPYYDLGDPHFTAEEISTESFEIYGELDKQGRPTEAFCCIGQDIMPTEPRGSIGCMKPTGWVQAKYPGIIEEGPPYLYNRCHLIAYQLSAENANECNLITGTRYMNVTGMQPFENQVANYVRQTGHHVMMRVTPIFHGKELVARGVQMEALSVEDDGEGISYNVFIYNVQPGIEIDYKTGNSRIADSANQ